jgi:hypothetical protein
MASPLATARIVVGNRQPGCELVPPEDVVANRHRRRTSRLELLPDRILIDHHAAADPAVECGRVAVPTTPGWIQRTAPDLPAGVDVGAVGGLALGILNPEYMNI